MIKIMEGSEEVTVWRLALSVWRCALSVQHATFQHFNLPTFQQLTSFEFTVFAKAPKEFLGNIPSGQLTIEQSNT